MSKRVNEYEVGGVRVRVTAFRVELCVEGADDPVASCVCTPLFLSRRLLIWHGSWDAKRIALIIPQLNCFAIHRHFDDGSDPALLYPSKRMPTHDGMVAVITEVDWPQRGYSVGYVEIGETRLRCGWLDNGSAWSTFGTGDVSTAPRLLLAPPKKLRPYTLAELVAEIEKHEPRGILLVSGSQCYIKSIHPCSRRLTIREEYRAGEETTFDCLVGSQVATWPDGSPFGVEE